MEFLEKFLSAYQKINKPFFGFSFLAEVTHEYTTRIASADTYLEQFFMRLKNDSYLHNTLLIVMSDHGHRFDSIRKTKVGHIEERMPFYAIHIPQTLTSLQPHAQDKLLLNSGRLVTPFDIYATLSDVLHLATSGRPLGKKDPDAERLGQTLFREIPLSRTCSEASIPIQYCVCETDTAIPVTDVRAQKAATATVSAINKLVVDGDLSLMCQARTLSSIRTANLVHTVEEAKDGPIDNKVRVMIETEPKGIFEALVSFEGNMPKMMGEISRLDQYHNQSLCIQHKILRKFCYCHLHPKKQ